MIYAILLDDSEYFFIGIFHSVLLLINAIDEYIEYHNASPEPFIWTKTANEILAKLKPIYDSVMNS